MAEDEPAELPASLRRLWGIESSPARGPRPGLSVPAVVAAAVEIADTEGLEAVSMARVAKALGFTTMALYRHVDSKDELLQLMLDAVAGQAPPTPPDADWRTATLAWISGLVEVHRRHPWALQVPVTTIPIGPNHVGWLEAGLAALRGSGLAGMERVALVTTLTAYVRADVSLTRDLSSGHPGEPWGEVERRHGQLLSAVLDPERFPEVASLLGEGLFGEATADEVEVDMGSAFGISLILDGVEALVARRTAAGG